MQDSPPIPRGVIVKAIPPPPPGPVIVEEYRFGGPALITGNARGSLLLPALCPAAPAGVCS